MKKVFSLLAILVFVLSVSSCASLFQDSAGNSTQPSTLQVLVTKVSNYLANGNQKSTLTQINDPQGIFTIGKAFAFVIDPKQNGKIIASADKSLLGKDNNTKDDEGKLFIKDITKLVASGKKEGNGTYTWNKNVKPYYFEKAKKLIVVASE